MGNKAVFLDRDGTMAKDVPYCSTPEDFHLFPGTVKAIKLLKKNGYKVIVVTNQSGIARGYFTEETLAEIHKKMNDELDGEDAGLDAVYYCPHHPDDNCGCRKPSPFLVQTAAKDFDIDLDRSFVVGDMPVDIGLGKAAGCRTILVNTNGLDEDLGADAVVDDIYQASEVILELEKGR